MDFICKVLDAISNVNEIPGGETTGVLGCEINTPSTSGFPQAIAAAQVQVLPPVSLISVRLLIMLC
jgi:hypothetical protein